MRLGLQIGMAVVVCVAGVSLGQSLPVRKGATTAEAVVDRTTPQKAMQTYFRALKAGDLKLLLASVSISDSKWKTLVELDLKYKLAQRALERAAIAKFGQEKGMTVNANLRSYDDQADIDIKRASAANVDVDRIDPLKATVLLKPDKNPIEGHKPEDTFLMQKVGEEWRLDYVRTYGWDSQGAQEQADAMQLNLILLPKVTDVMTKVTADIQKGVVKSADEAKSIVEAAWSLPESKEK